MKDTLRILIIAEHNHHSLKEASARVHQAALSLKGQIDVLVAGYECQKVAEQAACLKGVNKVILADHSAYQYHLAEPLSKLIHHLHSNYDAIIAPATSFGKDFLPRVAGMIEVQAVTDIISIIDQTTFKRPIYAGNAITTVSVSALPLCLTIRPTAFTPSTETQAPADIIQATLPEQPDPKLSQFVREEISHSDRPELTSAKIVLSGGRGLGSKEQFALLEALAEKMHAAIGASRAAVDAGYAPNDYQVGQTGKIVAPDLYMAFGISGAIQHIAGMKESRIIVAINKDENAPIFEMANYGLTMDVIEAITQLKELL